MKTFRLIGMALLAIVMCVNFTSCSDDEEEQGETYSIEGTWLLQSSKGYIENSNDKNTWDESYPDLQEAKLEITKNSNGKYTFKEYYFQDGSSSWENALYILSYIIRNNIDRYPSYNGLLGYCRNKIFR